MTCKYCGGELPEEETVCPACGRDMAEELPVEEAPAEEAPATPASNGPKPWVLGVIAVALALVIGVALFFILRDKPEKAPEETVSTEGTFPASYSGEDADLEPVLDQVVARVGTRELTNRELQIWYWLNYLNVTGRYDVSIDPTKPLDEQTYSEAGITWQQHFLNEALKGWSQMAALSLEAQAAGYEMPEDLQSQIDAVEGNLLPQAQNGGFETVDEMIAQDFGTFAVFGDYKAYLEAFYYSRSYYDWAVSQLDPSEEELSAYYDANESMLSEEGILKNTVPATMDVRHILISPEGGTTDGSGQTTYTDEEWAAAESKAQELLEAWQAGEATEDSFAALAGEHSTDPGSVNNGGLYENVGPGEMVTEFNDWCFTEGRKPGDTGIVRTRFGYHIMYFVSGSETPLWQSQTRQVYMQEKSEAILTEATEKYPLDVEYTAIVLGTPANIRQSMEEAQAAATEATETTLG